MAPPQRGRQNSKRSMTRSIVERLFLAVSAGVGGAVLLFLGTFALGLPVVPTFGSAEVAVAVVSTALAVPAYVALSLGAAGVLDEAGRSVDAAVSLLVGLVVAVLGVILLVGFSGIVVPGGFAGWGVVLVVAWSTVGLATFYLVERGILDWRSPG